MGQLLKTAVGIEKERQRDQEKRKKRLAREAELAKIKAELEKEIVSAAEQVTTADEAVKKAEAESAIKQAADAKSSVLLQHASDVDGLLKTSKASVSTARDALKELDNDDVDADLKSFVSTEAKKLESKCVGLDTCISKVEASLKKLKGDAKKKASTELEKLRNDGIAILRHHRVAKKLTNAELFAEIDSDKDGKIDEAELAAFFEKCEKPQGETVVVDPEEIPRLFDQLDEECEKAITEEIFIQVVRSYMKVAKETVMTSHLSIEDKESKMVVRLELKDVVEILQGPVKEESTEVSRVQARRMSDGIEGWISVSGNQGTTYLQQHSGGFRVAKETILTDSFDLTEKKEVTRSLHQASRKLAVGEIVEVREWPKKEDNSKLVRMKCRCKSDGRIGWATTVGNAGAVFLQAV